MNELDILMEPLDTVHNRFQYEWDDIEVAELAFAIQNRPDFRKLMTEGRHERGENPYTVSDLHERNKLEEAADLAGFRVVWGDHYMVVGLVPLEKEGGL